MKGGLVREDRDSDHHRILTVSDRSTCGAIEEIKASCTRAFELSIVQRWLGTNLGSGMSGTVDTAQRRHVEFPLDVATDDSRTSNGSRPRGLTR